jgi:signal peptidase I
VRWARLVLLAAGAGALGALTGCTFLWVGSDDESVRTFRIPSSAMEPTLHCARPSPGCLADREDEIEVRPEERYERGDIVVFETPPAARVRCGAGGLYAKRIVGLPGERVAIRRNGVVSLDGRPLDESDYIHPDRRHSVAGRWNIGRDEYFLLGDNRSQSCDSRIWGSLPREKIIGSVVAINRPSGRIELERN